MTIKKMVSTKTSKTSKPNSSRAKKTTLEPVVENVPESVPAVELPIENTVVELNSEVTPVNEHVEFYAKLNQILSIVSAMKKEFKNIESKNQRDLKAAQKAVGKKKKRQGTRTPSGFVKPTPISDELANFLGKEKGAEMARTAVTKEINNYIVLHNLKDKQNGRKIIPDQKLNDLLKIQDGEILTYFNLQRYMSPHFSKLGKPLVSSSPLVQQSL